MAPSAVVLGLSCLAFATWAVYLGGLASLQAKCNGDYCKTFFRYEWFVMSIEFVVVVALLVAAATGGLKRTRMAFLGLTAVNMLLYINVSNTFYAHQDSTPVTDMLYPSTRTALAGAIMTAVANGFLILALGVSDVSEEGPHFTGQPTTMVEKAPATAV